jgi:dihydroorotate dehydrogenase electron transfer subunit
MASAHRNQSVQPFVMHMERPRAVLLGEHAGIPPMLALAERLRGQLSCAGGCWKPLVLLGSDSPFPFRARPSSVIVRGMPTGVIACMPLLEEWDIPSRLATTSGFPGCFAGLVTELADAWLASLGPGELQEVEIFSCGPAAMLDATQALAQRYVVPCQGSFAGIPAESTRS